MEEQRVIVVGVDRRPVEFIVVGVLQSERMLAHGHIGGAAAAKRDIGDFSNIPVTVRVTLLSGQVGTFRAAGPMIPMCQNTGRSVRFCCRCHRPTNHMLSAYSEYWLDWTKGVVETGVELLVFMNVCAAQCEPDNLGPDIDIAYRKRHQ